MTSVAIAFTPTGSGAHVYYRAMTVAFASLRRWNPAVRLVLVTDAEPPASVAELAEVRLVPFRHRPPDGFVAERMRGCLYMLDALAAMAGQDVLFVDPDVVCTASVNELFEHVGGTVGAYPMDSPPGHEIWGQSRTGAGEIHQLLGEGRKMPMHYGGECYLFPTARMPEVLHHTERAWQLSLQRHAQGLSWLPTEEHLLGYALNRTPVTDLRPYIRRIWTSASCRTVDGKEAELRLWHLPAEKRHGFQSLYRVACDRTSWFWTADRETFLARTGRALSVTRLTPWRYMRDRGVQGVKRARDLVLTK